MADRVKITVYVQPIEELTDENAGTTLVVASEVARNLGGSASINITDYSGTAAAQGYKDAAVNYLECIDSDDTTDISSETTASVVYIENTGYTYSSATTLGAALDKSVKVMIGTTMISIIPSGGAICLMDVNAGLDCTNIHVRTVDDDGGDNASAGHLAVRYLVVD